MTKIIELLNVGKNYRRGNEEIHALSDVSLEARTGQFLAIVGPSGSGKTTLLQQIGCVDLPTSGRILIDGEDVTKLSDSQLTHFRSRTIGFVFQRFFLLPTLTALENVKLPCVFTKHNAHQTKADELLKHLGLGDRLHHRPSQLSGGEMQRVAIARALVNQPRILLADEPTGNLDSSSAHSIISIFRELNESGLTVLMVTHNMELASMAQQILYLKDGRITKVE